MPLSDEEARARRWMRRERNGPYVDNEGRRPARREVEGEVGRGLEGDSVAQSHSRVALGRSEC
jgi:hypothetical protein